MTEEIPEPAPIPHCPNCDSDDTEEIPPAPDTNNPPEYSCRECGEVFYDTDFDAEDDPAEDEGDDDDDDE